MAGVSALGELDMKKIIALSFWPLTGEKEREKKTNHEDGGEKVT